MPLSIDLHLIDETSEEFPRFGLWLAQFLRGVTQLWKRNRNRRSGPAKIIERRH